MAKYYDLNHCGPCASVNDSLRIRTDTTLDQDCALKATVQVCTACMDVSLLKTCMNVNTPPLAQVAPCDARFASQTRKKERLPTQSVQAPECLSDHHGSCTNTAWSRQSVCSLFVILARPWALDRALKVVRQIRRSVSITKFRIVCCCSCIALALLIAVMIHSSWEVPQTCPPFLGFT